MILDRIAGATRKRVGLLKDMIAPDAMKKQALSLPVLNPFRFEKSLQKDDIAFICEIKKASPSKGVIAGEFPYLDIARDYEAAGADAISVLTEPEFFLGSSRYLHEIHRTVSLPLLRKDFTVDEYQIYEAKTLGAGAVLLICALLDTDTLRAYLQISDALGLSALVEAHDEAEIESALRAGARLIGVNNRNLKSFAVDVNNCTRLRSLVGDGALFVAESGIRSPEEIALLREAKVDAVLIGETMMRAPDKTEMLTHLKGEGQKG
ncbi:indole-3-glycerol phosphate synthase TrpC [Candidatus Soleaferrea massiliensis]|uniref:indole-3-glycerol phosphate synthase TrpC n=1 Tax=Candidatus Soleaferrea massiliensis TaxID=1470354 RepID=UPI00058ABD0E|nr:indole-3-glycerol phosphate synthase TrpC [Candidatus Soleaferrea massiliensis]